MRLQNRCAGIVAAMLAVAVLPLSAQAPAQPRPPQTFPAYLQGHMLRSSATSPDRSTRCLPMAVAFKPVPEVMSYAEMLTHIVETQYGYCSTVKGAANPGAGLNFKVTDKAAVGQLVKDSFADRDDAFAAVTNENALEMMTRGFAPNERQLARVNQLTQLIVHGNEHYGNLVTYMRMKGNCTALVGADNPGVVRIAVFGNESSSPVDINLFKAREKREDSCADGHHGAWRARGELRLAPTRALTARLAQGRSA